jgi:hypothetical protein
MDLADDVAVADFFETIRGNVSKINDMKSIGANNRFLCGVCAFETLAETTKFLGI